MKKILLSVFCVVIFSIISTNIANSREQVIYNCERYIKNWKVPEWSLQKTDYVSPILAINENFKKDSNSSLKLIVSFPGESWSAGIIETEGCFDLTLHKAISFDVYLPKGAPQGIEARTIIVSGEVWQWFEMKNSVEIKPGHRTTVFANLRYGNHNWNTQEGVIAITDAIKANICKIGIRIESNIVKYEGPVYIDNIKLVK